ncbi:amino acid racemase [Actinomadura sp. ATCC 31491]|uniref:Amino acid racemase n=1 Tax=Actinomadura luzonensis TaxID=2805427 RepID=A0ABT0FZK7_9ACTN|nr:amino acid racemase [Actinomadura luzonensis]MCK2217772.1 amino acid racemase [Actinomadura luzonensis]
MNQHASPPPAHATGPADPEHAEHPHPQHREHPEQPSNLITPATGTTDPTPDPALTSTPGPSSTWHHLGILAHSTEGAALSFLSFCQEGFHRLGDHDHPDVTLDYIPFGRSMPAWDAGDHDTVRRTLAASVTRLARTGAAFFICPDNTAHLALERPGDALALPGLHIAEVVADQAARDGRTRVAVLGTAYTMAGDVYPRALAARGLTAELPSPQDRRTINDIIFRELVNGVFTDHSRRAYVDIIERLATERGCDAVALACTEIPLLITPADSPLPTLDSTRLLSSAAFEAATGARPFPTWRGGPTTPREP